MRHEVDGGTVGIAFLLLTILFVLMMWVAAPAHSQDAPPGPPCAQSQAIMDQLQKQFGETLTAAGMVGPQQFMEITTNPDTGSFTVLVRRPDGMSCIVIGGKGFALADPVKKKGQGL